jgi:hypothetical protein
MGLKAHDYRIAALCYTCHSKIDQGYEWTKDAKFKAWDEAHRKTIGWLFETGRITLPKSS